MEIKLNIESCQKCPHFHAERYYSPDSFEAPSFDWYCKASENKEIRGYVEWHEESKIKIPDWCPYSETEKESLIKRAFEVIEWMSESPYQLDQASISSKGIDAAPNQVVGVMSLSYVKYKELCEIAKKIKK